MAWDKACVDPKLEITLFKNGYVHDVQCQCHSMLFWSPLCLSCETDDDDDGDDGDDRYVCVCVWVKC